MNNIYKVIWSKAKNCYVVASEIARSHTKSASGSTEKIGGVTRKTLLALGAACAIICGGFVNVGAADGTVIVDDTAGTEQTIYTKDGADAAFGTKADVTTNKDNIFALKETVGNADSGLVKKTNDNTTGITANRTDIDNLKNTVGDVDSGLVKKTADNTTNIASNKTEIENLKNTVGDADSGLVKKTNDNTTAITDLTNTVSTKANQSDLEALEKNTYTKSDIDTKLTEAGNSVDTKLAEKADKSTTLAGYGISDAYTKAETDKEITNKVAAEATARDAAITEAIQGEAEDRENSIKAAVAKEIAERNEAIKTAVDAEANARDTAIKKVVDDEKAAREAKDTELEGKINKNATDIKANADAIAKEKSDREAKDTELDEKITATNSNLAQEIKDREAADTALSTRIEAEVRAREDADKILSDRTTNLEENTGGIKRNTEDTQTTIEGVVKVDNQGNIKDVKNLGAETVSTTGNATIGEDLEVKGETSLKNTKVDGTLETTGKATFDNDVDVKGNLKVDGTLDVGEIAMKNDKLDADGKKHDSATTITADGISNIASVKESGKTTESQFTHNEKGTFNHAKEGDSTDWKEATSNVTADGVENIAKDSKGNNNTFTQTSTETKNTLTDAAGNTSSTRQDAKGNYGYAKDTAGNKSYTKQQGDRIAESVIGKDGKETKSEMTTTDITNTATSGTIKNDAKDIVNSASGNISNSSATMDTTVTGEAKESYGKLTTTVENDESHTVKGNQINEVGGDQTNTIKGNQTTTVTGNISNSATNITNTASEKLTDKVGENTRVIDKTSISDTVGNANRKMADGQIDDTIQGVSGNGSSFRQRIDAIMGNVKSADGESEVIQNGNQITSVVGKGETTNSKVTQTKDMLQTALTDGTNYNVSQDAANASAKLLTDGTKINKTLDNLDSSERKLTNGTYETSSLQTALDITNTAKDGTIKNDAKDIENIASGNIKNSSATMETTVTGKATESYGELETTVNGDEKHTVKGNQTNEVDGNQTNTIKGNQTTTVTGDISNSATNITNEASEKLTDKVGSNTRVLDNEGITDTVGNTSFKQRINDIMMEAKQGTITSDAKNIVNKATETITNEAVNITNNATGTIASNASEIKNKADKLISNKVGENTYQNIEDGKITESIKNGTKQNLTQSDADKTEHSVVDGTNSSVTKQTSTTIEEAVTDGTNANASLKNASMSAETITNGTQVNTVASTANGTTFTNSDASTALTEGGATNTTIKGNTITTGKVTMDYAQVMKDLGVNGNANVKGKTTTGSLEVTGTSTLKGDVTMESNATVKKNLTVEENATIKKDLTVEGTTTTKDLKVTKNASVGGTLDVTGKATFSDSVDIAKDLAVGGNATITGDVTANSYKVGNNTYIDSDGLNANNQVIRNVADGSISEGSKEAVNGGQLYQVKNDLEGKVNKVGANAAAMANLHPMEFDPDSKWNIAAAMGNYGSETATAMGLFYRPNEDVMVNLSTAFGTGENMVGGGVSVRLGKGGNKLTRQENNELKAQVNDLTARMDALLSVLNPNMSKDFPDVPENHWAYEAVSRLAGNDIIQGYPDGEFHGDRTMTRYEMAEIIYNALSQGAAAEKELVEEFKPELQALAASNKATADAPAEG